MHRNIFLLLITFSLMSSAVAQEHTLELTLEETIEQARQQSPDHPILWNVPETDYLKFYLFQIV